MAITKRQESLTEHRLHWTDTLQLTATVILGLLCLWIAERSLTGSSRWVFAGLGLGLVAGSKGIAGIRWLRTQEQRRKRLSFDIATHLSGVVVAILIYFLGAWQKQGWDETWILYWSIGWPTLLLFSALPAFFLEQVWQATKYAPLLESWRVTRAKRSALISLLTIVTFSAINYWAHENEVARDLSYFQTSQVGDSNRKMLSSIDSPLRIHAAFPEGNDVRQSIQYYMNDLQSLSPNILVRFFDRDLDPLLAKELELEANGKILFEYKGGRETIHMTTDIQKSAQTLRDFDKEVHRRLTKLLNEERLVYVTQGHGERSLKRGDNAARPSIDALRRGLQRLGFKIEPLGFLEGLGESIPADASAVLLPGPTQALSSEVQQSLIHYVAKGGRLLVFVDPDEGSAQNGFLNRLGVSVDRHLITSPRPVLTGASPTLGIIAKFEDHPVTRIVSRALSVGNRIPPFFEGASNITITADALELELEGHKHLAYTDRRFFIDLNGNGRLDEGQERAKPAAVLTIAQGQPNTDAATARIAVLSDSAMISDAFMRQEFRGNQDLIMGLLGWLIEREELLGAVETEVDRPLIVRREADWIWFWGANVGVPLFVLAIGAWVNRRHSRQKPLSIHTPKHSTASSTNATV